MAHVRRQHGFVLVITLLLIALVSLILAGMVRQSVTIALDSVDAQDRLQRRWGAISCRRTLLTNVHTILAGSQTGSRPSSANPLVVKKKLGEFVFELWLADENSKVNLNSIQFLASRSQVMNLTRALSRHESRDSPTVRLRPNRIRPNQPTVPYESWEQVFQFTSARVLPRATRNITCWGSGKLNVLRATNSSILALFRAIGDPSAGTELIGMRRQIPRPGLSEMLRQISLNRPLPQQVQVLLTEESNCFSLWMSISSEGSSEQSFHVVESNQQQRLETKPIADFTW